MSHVTRRSSLPYTLDHKRIEIQAEHDAELLEALRIAKERLGKDHPLVKAAIKSLRAKERRRVDEGKDALTAELSLPLVEPSTTRSAINKARWRKAHPTAARALEHKRRAHKRGNGGTHTPEDITAQYDRQKGKCFYCAKKVGKKYHVDHVVPLAKGGSNGPENLVIACPSCNCRKHDKHPMDFAGILL